MNTKQIAQRLVTDYNNGDYGIIEHGRMEFYIDGMTIRCQGTIEAVMAVAAKFNAGVKRSWVTQVPKKPASTARRFSIKAFNQFLMDCEPDNAVHYAQLFDWKSMSPEIQASVRHAAGLTRFN